MKGTETREKKRKQWMIKRGRMGENKMTEIIFLWRLQRGKVYTTAEARLTAKPSITIWLGGLVCWRWGHAARNQKQGRNSLGCTSAHVCPCCPRTARFSVMLWEPFGELGKIPTFLCCSLVFSDSDSVILLPHSHTQTAQRVCPVLILESKRQELNCFHNQHLAAWSWLEI